MGEDAATRSNQNRQVGDISVEMLPLSIYRPSGDNDRRRRTGTLWTATAHTITAMVGTGALGRAWDIAQLGWIAGPAVVFLFSFVSYYTSCLLADCYRSGDPVSGRRNHTYMDTVHSILGGTKAKVCSFIQYLTLFGTASRITLDASISMMAIKYMNCSRESRWENKCYILSNPYMIMFGITEILVSQIPHFDQIWWISMVSTVMSFTVSLIAIGLGIAQVAANGSPKGSLTGTSAGTETQKIWSSIQAVGFIAGAYSFSDILIEIEDTIRSPPSEATTMKKAIARSTVVLATIYMLSGCMGYAAFGDSTPENLLTSDSFDKPFWLIELGNAAIVIFLVGVYRIYCQPIFDFVEKQAARRWPGSEVIKKEIKIPVPALLGQYNMKLFRLVWRTIFVMLTTVLSMLFPLVSEVVDIITLGFWPLAVYFPIEMYIKQKEIPKWSTRWVCLQILSMACLVVSIMATAGSIAELMDELKDYRPFKMSY